MADFHIRPWQPERDDLEEITAMLHRAYAPLAAAGMNFTACDQVAEVTQRRLSRGHALVAESKGRIVGTLTIYPAEDHYTHLGHGKGAGFSFGQFGVDPDCKGHGIGRALHEVALAYASSHGGRFMELDTAVPAVELIATYERWGYRIVSREKWPGKTYASVIMRRETGHINPDGGDRR